MNAGAVRVRRMVAGDLDRVVEIANGLPEAPHWPVDAYQSPLNSADLDPIAPARRIALVAEKSGHGQVVGFLVASVVTPESELETIAVAADAQRAGVGRRLIETMFEALQEEKVTKVHLEVRSSNERALRLYRGYGFVETGRRPGYYSDPVEDAVLMARPLPPANGE
jgi:ribosomal-protein-alanine N-acetyltransferase